jgi:hypothetical protein
VKRKEFQNVLHSTWRRENIFLEEKKLNVSINAEKKKTIHQIMLRDLKFLLY